MENTTGHTPGPWKLHEYPGHVEAENGMACCGHETIIASTLAHSCNDQLLQAEQAANAQLIAAAPMLKAIVEGFLGTLATNDAYQVHRYYDANIELFNLAVDTIQELRGE